MRYSLLIHGIAALSFALVCVTVHPNVTICAVFEEFDYNHSHEVFYRAVSDIQAQYPSLGINGLAIPSMNNIYDSIEGICTLFESNNVMVFIVMGSTDTINSVSLLAEPLGIPVLGYVTDHLGDNDNQVHSNFYLRLEPSMKYMGRGFVRFFAANYWHDFLLLIEEEYIFDGFYEELKTNTNDDMWKYEERIMRRDLPLKDIQNILSSSILDREKIIVLHTSPALAVRIFKAASNCTDINVAWFYTEKAFTRNLSLLQHYPIGSLALLMKETYYLDDLLRDTVSLVSQSFSTLSYENRDLISKLKRDCENLSPANKYSGTLLYRQLKNLTFIGLTGNFEFDDDGYLKSSTFEILNLVKDGRHPTWRYLGYVKEGDISPFGILWPGETVNSHIIDGKKRYRIVTNPVKPFVMHGELEDDVDDCARDTVCLKIFTKDKIETINVLRDYENGFLNESNPWKIRCCRGLTIDLLNRLSSDLDFDYTLYIVQDETYGKEINGTWNGMVHDLMIGTAHMAVAAMSITRSRQKVIDFTSPYFFSGFSVLYTERKRYTQMHAFLEPFSPYVWVSIFASATVASLAMGLFEWNSPFGLNPWGRKRKSNYSLASGLTMVYSVLFGHTVRTKSPKSWPGKVMQNFWACASIFIIASYTANLAAFIAGKHAGIVYNDIYDNRMLDIRIGVLGGSAVEALLKKINHRLYLTSQNHHVQNTDIGIQMLINETLDAYLGDYPILDFARAKLDPKCRLRLLSQLFGEDGYGIGLPRLSPLRKPLSEQIQKYHENGYIEDLIDVHFADAICLNQRISQEESQLEVQHHAGLFVMLSVGILLGIFILALEYGTYRWFVPFCRKKPASSRWKGTNILFLSQRLHRIITSVQLVSAQDSAREMIGIVKNRDFAKLFQKSTIRRNKLSDLAKTKRLNRNFLDIVEKAKWMQDMRDNNLFGDDSPSSGMPSITEISLRDLCSQIDFDALKSQTHEGGSSCAIDDDDELSDACNASNSFSGWYLPETEVDKMDVEGQRRRSNHSNHREDILLESMAPRIEDVSEFSEYAQRSLENDKSNEKIEYMQKVPRRSLERGHLPNGHLMCLDRHPTHKPDVILRPDSPGIYDYTEENKPFLPSSIHKTPSLPLQRKKNRTNKRSSLQETCFDGEVPVISYDEITKDDLLAMWKASEEELNGRLDKALREKSLLEKQLALLDVNQHTNV